MNVENWSGESGFITSSMIKNYVEQPEKCVYYLSGPPGMVRAYTTMLKKENVPPTNIHTDFFPGYE
jgi:Na+-transporting NADH:ubiquinone oxidoreductase subunit NqrF